MRVLVACEFSGIVRDAFSAAGHNAWSCDLLPTERPGQHHQGDVLRLLTDGWDMMIAHPPCTYLCASGLHWNGRTPGRQEQTEEALQFVRHLLDAPIKHIALENPIGCIGTRIRKAEQTVQPWMFGDNASKATCLWLKNLPPLSPTKIVPPAGWKRVKFLGDLFDEETEEAICDECGIDFAECECPGPTQDEIEYAEVCGVMFGRPKGQSGKPVWGNQTPSGQNKLGPSPDRAKIRSRTYEGIAQAMAAQWGCLEAHP